MSLLNGIMIILLQRLDWFPLSSTILSIPLSGKTLMAKQPPPAMTVGDVAGFVAVDEKTIYRRAQQGKLPGFKVAGTWKFQLQDIPGWVDCQKKARGNPATFL